MPWHRHSTLDTCLVQVKTDGDAVTRIPAVKQIISVTVVIHIHVIVVVPIAVPVFRPRIDQTEPKAAVLEAAIAANKLHGKNADSKTVVLAIVGAETGIGNAITAVTTALLPGAVIRLPVLSALTLPRRLLLMCLSGVSLLYGPVARLLTRLALLGLLSLDLPLLVRRGGALRTRLPLLSLLAWLPLLPLLSSDLLLLIRGVASLLARLRLLPTLLRAGRRLLLLARLLLLLLLLPIGLRSLLLLLLRPVRLRLLLFCGFALLLLILLRLPIIVRLIVVSLARSSRHSHSDNEKRNRCTNHSK